MLTRAYDILEPMFIDSVLPESGHGLMATQERWEALLQTLPNTAQQVRDNLTKQWSSPRDISTPAEKWAEVKQHLHVLFGKKAGNNSKMAKHVSEKDRQKVELWPVEVVFRHTSPRLDINVSKMQNHLLKSPFCVHPKTGRICVPIQIEQVEDFDPFDVPTLPKIIRESVANHQKGNEEASKKNVRDWQKTSLKKYFEPFRKNFLEPLHKDLRRRERDVEEEKAAIIGDF